MGARTCFFWAVLIAIVAMLAGCGGSGGSDDSDDGSSSATDPGSDRVTAVEPLSEHRLRVTFSEAPEEDELDPANYAILDSAGDPLAILSVRQLDGSNQILIATEAQQRGGYTLIYPVAQDEPSDPDNGTAFTGSMGHEPALAGLEVIDLQHLRLTFSQALGPQARDASLYTIFRADADTDTDTDAARTAALQAGDFVRSSGAARRMTQARSVAAGARVSAYRRALRVAVEPADTLPVIDAEFGDNTAVIILTTKTMDEPQDYILIAGNIRGETGAYLDPTRNTAQFSSDVTPPRLLQVKRQGSTTLVLTFSEPLGPSAENAANYALQPPASAVVNALLVNAGDQVVLTTEPLFDTQYDLTVSNIRDLRQGLLIDPTARVATFAGSTTVDTTAPRMVTAASADNKTVTVQFSKAMGVSAANPENYTIAPQQAGRAELHVQAAAFVDATRLTVALTTDPQQAIPYKVTAIGVGDLGGRPLGSDNPAIEPNRATFDGIEPPPSDDVTPPLLLSVEPQGPSTLLLTFSEAVNATADDPANYIIRPATDVLSAQRNADNTRVQLETGRLFAAEYQLTASNIEDLQGLLIDPARKTAAFIGGGGTVNNTRPRVVSAISGGNTMVLVGFSKALADNALNPGSYSIVQEEVNPEVGFVPVKTAEFVDDARLEVRLTTGSQNEVSYRVKVSGVTDLGGRPLASQERGIDPTSALFAGTPPSNEQLVDSDGDGVTDNVETRGYVVTIRLANGETTTYEVTANPDSADSDNDGLSDAVETNLVSDPRSSDTDADGLTDYQEVRELFSSPTNQDSDGDGLKDGSEYSFFLSSPILADTDGDQVSDQDEVTRGGRNVQVADIPEPGLEIGEMNLGLDVRFVESNRAGSTTIDSKTATATLSQSESRAFSNSASQTQESMQKVYGEATVSAEISYKTGFPDNELSGSAKASVTAGGENTNSSASTTSWSRNSRQSTQEAYQDSLTTGKQVTEGSTLTRQVDGARMSVAVTLKNTGHIAFTISNIQITALIQDPQDPSRLVPVATLVPDVGGADAEFNLGTLSRNEIGPVIFANDKIFPQLVESLMANPKGLVFRFSNYDIIDEFGRNFAFTSQDIIERTAALVIDYGGTDSDNDGVGDLSEAFRVTTGSGRRIDTDGDGDIDTHDRRVVFGPDGKPVGITLRAALQATGLRQYVFAVGDTPPIQALGLTPEQVEDSYTVQTGVNNAGEAVQRIYRIRGTTVKEGVNTTEWAVVTPTGINRRAKLDQLILNPGAEVLLAFVQDLDKDRMPALLEFSNNCSDAKSDTDGDGLDDRYEVLVGWTVDRGGQRSLGRRVSSCASTDTDQDGLSDRDEAPGAFETDDLGRIIAFPPEKAPRRKELDDPAPPECADMAGAERTLCIQVEREINDPITDPTRIDTDGDGLSDAFELRGDDETPGYEVELLDGSTVTVQTSPERVDSDGDGAGDGLEIGLGGNPRKADAAGGFGDTDGDGLLDVQETDGWVYQVDRVNDDNTLCPTTGCPTNLGLLQFVQSDVTKPDSDLDGLSDLEEFKLGTDPTQPDTDSDGLSDVEEVNGFATAGVGDFGILTTDPLDADSDDDKRFDGAEVGRVPPLTAAWSGFTYRDHVVRVPGEAPIRSFTNPLVADADLDQVVDGDEVRLGGAPVNANTDGDNSDDRAEAERGTRLNVPDFLVTLVFTKFEVTYAEADAAHFWYFNLSILGPNGGQVGAVVLNKFFFEGTGAYRAFDKKITSIPVGSVSSTEAAFEKITLEGSVVLDDYSPYCNFIFPSATGGVFSGPELRLGHIPFALKGSCYDGDAGFQLSGYLEVR